MKTTTALRFTLQTTQSGLFYTPRNDAAKSVIPKGRKCLRSFEMAKLIEEGAKVELNLNPYLAVEYWVAVNPVANA